MTSLKINGVEKRFENMPQTVSQLLEQLKVDAATVVAEVDGQIVEKEKFSTMKLAQGQAIELIRFVPGG
jgi:sulfur carrier protein